MIEIWRLLQIVLILAILTLITHFFRWSHSCTWLKRLSVTALTVSSIRANGCTQTLVRTSTNIVNLHRIVRCPQTINCPLLPIQFWRPQGQGPLRLPRPRPLHRQRGRPVRLADSLGKPDQRQSRQRRCQRWHTRQRVNGPRSNTFCWQNKE